METTNESISTNSRWCRPQGTIINQNFQKLFNVDIWVWKAQRVWTMTYKNAHKQYYDYSFDKITTCKTILRGSRKNLRLWRFRRATFIECGSIVWKLFDETETNCIHYSKNMICLSCRIYEIAKSYFWII